VGEEARGGKGGGDIPPAPFKGGGRGSGATGGSRQQTFSGSEGAEYDCQGKPHLRDYGMFGKKDPALFFSFHFLLMPAGTLKAYYALSGLKIRGLAFLPRLAPGVIHILPHSWQCNLIYSLEG